MKIRCLPITMRCERELIDKPVSWLDPPSPIREKIAGPEYFEVNGVPVTREEYRSVLNLYVAVRGGDVTAHRVV